MIKYHNLGHIFGNKLFLSKHNILFKNKKDVIQRSANSTVNEILGQIPSVAYWYGQRSHLLPSIL